ncbi:RagB/SusD family nutrient uptake outer membrane protein [Pedobacter polysacchareus]|uniref:RagB/SusD family nutrient uptake outer membrane protein n=1 Tax=Pedobacter polysacchareus TaxID=2861973 RepID=UPI001C99053E|nr:RagB/SusD family nutrient uptake outer membrane protein [Pedobacter polysacchareus]
MSNHMITPQKDRRNTLLNYSGVALLLLSLLGMSGCAKFLDLPPRDKFPQDVLFNDEQGFIDALTGVYLGMDKPNNGGTQGLYTNNLSLGMLSVMANNYTNAQNSTLASSLYANTSRYSYTDAGVKAEIAGIWGGMYNNIANINNLLLHIDKKKSLFTRDNFSRVKGEALALRALFHFDLARLYGQPPLTGATEKAIPYVTEFNIQSKSFVTLNTALDSCIADLQQAKSLLAQTDTTALKKGSYDLFSSYTQNHMNFWATQALLARVYQYKGDIPNARTNAMAVIGSGKFPLIDKDVAGVGNAIRDRMFSQELVFSLYSTSLAKINVSTFDLQSGSLQLSAAGKTSLYLGTTGSVEDFRYKSWFDANAAGLNVPSKIFQDVNLPYVMQNIMPLIRVSELYYIAAESAADLPTGLAYLNQVRISRGLKALTTASITDAETLSNEIMKEYQKEFIQEGQTFFYYKRLNKNLSAVTGIAIVPPGAYVFPIPDKEQEYNH